MSVLFFLYSTLVLFTIPAAQAEDFFPHGLEFETPVALTPSAHNFFNSMAKPDQQQADSRIEHSCAGSVCSPLPHAAELALQQGSTNGSLTSPAANRRALSSKGIAGIVLGLVATVFLGSLVYHVIATRRANSIRARPVEPRA